MLLFSNIRDKINKKQALKVVIGLNNFNVSKIIQKVKAAEIAKATYVDVAANSIILHEIRKKSSIPICVSSIDFSELYRCFQAGADLLEIGNFNVFYKKDIMLSAQQIISLADKLIKKAPNATICVTVPCYVSLAKQVDIAKRLEKLGVYMIQTEGYSNTGKLPLVRSLKNASLSLSSTYILSQNVQIPVISASKINPLSASTAILAGAYGVAIGSFLYDKDNLWNLTESIFSVVRSIEIYNNTLIDSKNISLCQNIICNYIVLDRIKVLY
jgi:Protein of unknown function (DUF561)|uniref:Uncharacterized protein ycf23 n=1 Tax=Thorea hispida TaxID=202687 RepID=A0A1C9CAF4_9FLOR|nr:hypothetical protein Thor_080 [Thorea hispida]AOM65372.1 hypothetical protein Thor_080 [Thorea hispida]ARX95934.1 hypothetical protein [Thorea hispida]UNJ79059.1 hypothetical protein [Thorea hispida]